jgi:hypothetical protein
MERLSIPAGDMRFVEALRELIRTGVMAAPGLESSPLIDLPIVQTHSGAGASAAKRAYIFIKILQQVIKQRLEGKDAETANILFGFEGYAGVPIQDRYRAVAKLYNPYWSWENYRKEPLTRHLLTVYLTLKREAEVQNSIFLPSGHPRKARSGLVGQDWMLERFEGIYTLPSEQGQPLEAIQTRRLRAVCGKIDTYRHPTYVRERGVSSVPHTSLLGSGKVTVTDTHLDPLTHVRIYITEIKFPKPIAYGESIEFTLVKRVDAKFEEVIQDEGWDWYGLVSLASPAESASIGLRFPALKRPRAVWCYEDIISGLVRPGSPNKKNRLSIDESGFTSCSWSDLSAGYSYGMSLRW